MKIRPEKKIQACTGFEPMTSAIPLLVSTVGIVQRTVWRIWILMLKCKGFDTESKGVIFNCISSFTFHSTIGAFDRFD